MRVYWPRKSRKLYDLAARCPGVTVDGHSRLLIQMNIELPGHDKHFLNKRFSSIYTYEYIKQ
jgi:hypothetical protein